ncbi:pentapeptide repeat-containing protein [Undibacterium sp. JH2W]|uniref:pentapeptide repeat-containing protein n=1 Tax=Undibacterium sp. JH2W TaxID=3413037 RepID=UPI003BF33506
MTHIVSRLLQPNEYQLEVLEIIKKQGFDDQRIEYFGDWEIRNARFSLQMNKEITFLKCLLQQCDFSDLDTVAHSLYESNVIDSNFTKSRFRKSWFESCVFENTDFSDTKFVNCHFKKVVFKNVSFDHTDLSDSSFRNCDLSQINLDTTLMWGAHFIDCILSDRFLSFPGGKWQKGPNGEVFVVSNPER